MIKAITMVRRADGISRADFRSRYESDLVPVVEGLAAESHGYTRNHVVESLIPAGWEPNFDVVSSLWFGSRQELGRCQVALKAELAGHASGIIDETTCRTAVFEERQSAVPRAPAAVREKVVLFVARRDLLTLDEFKVRYETGHAVLAKKLMLPHLIRYVRNYVVESPTTGWRPDFDVMTEFWFDSIDTELSKEEIQYLVRDEEVFMDRATMRALRTEELGAGPGQRK